MISLVTIRKVLEAAQALDREHGLDLGTRQRYVGTLRLMLAELRMRADQRDGRKLYALENEIESL